METYIKNGMVHKVTAATKVEGSQFGQTGYVKYVTRIILYMHILFIIFFKLLYKVHNYTCISVAIL